MSRSRDLVLRVASRFAAKLEGESTPLAQGDLLVLWMKKGEWWSELRRGAVFVVREVKGDVVRILERGNVMSSGFEMRVAPGQDLSGKFRLDAFAGPFKRALIVTRQVT